ncbi:hypothetical protein [Allokutzneria oryzae]|uniref:Uncharacterized protein n=1 Tax=Allokutzneria oryzae TaxID=1378989 RepID=A0ABV6A8W8_9PSEU
MADHPQEEPVRQRPDKDAIRDFVRANHPDVGGDPDVFIEGLARLRAELAGSTDQHRPAADEVVFVDRRSGVRGLVRRALRWRARRRRPPRVR